MHRSLCLILIIIPYFLNAQDIIPIPADLTSEWRVVRAVNNYNCADFYNSIYYVNGTTVIEGKEYYKIYETGDFYQEPIWPPGPCNTTYTYEGIYRGPIRTEGGKVYTYDGEEEQLLMDFTLNEGDTLFALWEIELIVESIDSVLISEEYRKRFNFIDNGYCTWMIEGLGHERGLFEPMELVLEFSSEFICYGEGNIPLFGDMGCILNVGIDKRTDFIPNLVIYPNPAHYKVNIINSNKGSEITSYELKDLFGVVLAGNQIELNNQNEIEINLENLESGIYILILNSSDNHQLQRKIIKN